MTGTMDICRQHNSVIFTKVTEGLPVGGAAKLTPACDSMPVSVIHVCGAMEK